MRNILKIKNSVCVSYVSFDDEEDTYFDDEWWDRNIKDDEWLD